MPSMAVLAEEQHSGAIPVEDGFTADIDAVNTHDQVRLCSADQGVNCGAKAPHCKDQCTTR